MARSKTPRIAGEAAPRGLSTFGGHIPLLTTLAALPSLPRWQLVRIANRAIECIDLIDGDPDEEGNGDEGEADSEEAAVVYGWRPGGLSYVAASDCEDAEDDLEDCCSAGDDHIVSGPTNGIATYCGPGLAGSDDDGEVDVWSHPDDHPSELFIGKRREQTP